MSEINEWLRDHIASDPDDEPMAGGTGEHMSWACNFTGRAGVLAKSARQRFADTGGCPKETAEEAAKNKCGEIVERLAGSIIDSNMVLRVTASGSAWNEAGSARSQYLELKVETLGDFME